MSADRLYYECQVCFENMSDRNPKQLQCRHSFCFKCLEKVSECGEIECSICKKQTLLSDGGIEALPNRPQMIQIQEKELKVLDESPKISFDVKTDCQLCASGESIKICEDCSKRMCQGCAIKHGQLTECQTHVVLQLCKKHTQGFRYLCVTCVEALCVLCVKAGHSEHEVDVKGYYDGLEFLREKVRHLAQNVSNGLDNVRKQETLIGKRLMINSDIQTGLHERSDQQERLTKTLRGLVEEIDKIMTEGKDSAIHCATTTRDTYQQVLTSLDDMLTVNDESLIQNFKSSYDVLWKLFEDIEKQSQVGYKVAPFVLDDPRSLKIVKYWRPNYGDIGSTWMPAEPRSVLNIQGHELELKWPRQIVTTEKSIFIANDFPRQVIRLDSNAELTSKYFPMKPRTHVRGLALSNDCLYIHTRDEITKIPLGYLQEDGREVYEVGTIENILVQHDGKIVISDGQNPGTIKEYDPYSRSVRVCVYGLAHPSYISLIYTEDGPRYIVTMKEAFCLYLFDQNWDLVNTIGTKGNKDGEFKSPQSTAVTSLGNIIAADSENHRITEFTPDGQFIRNVLTSKNLNQPYGLSFMKDILWITEGNNKRTAKVKCFDISNVRDSSN